MILWIFFWRMNIWKLWMSSEVLFWCCLIFWLMSSLRYFCLNVYKSLGLLWVLWLLVNWFIGWCMLVNGLLCEDNLEKRCYFSWCLNWLIGDLFVGMRWDVVGGWYYVFLVMWWDIDLLIVFWFKFWWWYGRYDLFLG